MAVGSLRGSDPLERGRTLYTVPSAVTANCSLLTVSVAAVGGSGCDEAVVRPLGVSHSIPFRLLTSTYQLPFIRQVREAALRSGHSACTKSKRRRDMPTERVNGGWLAGSCMNGTQSTEYRCCCLPNAAAIAVGAAIQLAMQRRCKLMWPYCAAATTDR